MKLVRLALLLGLLASATAQVFAQKLCQPSKHARLPTIIDLTYHKARPKLLANGWQPFQTVNQNKASIDQNIADGNGQGFWKKGYREVEAGTGLAPCAFLFEDAYRNRLRVTTAGEDSPRGKYFARVTGNKFVCDE